MLKTSLIFRSVSVLATLSVLLVTDFFVYAQADPAFIKASYTEAGPDAEDPPERDLPRVTLQAALAEALEHELRVHVSRAEIERAHGLVQSARAGFLPTLTGRLAYTRLDNDRKAGNNVLSARNQEAADLTLSVPIFAPKAWNDTGFASDSVRVAELSAAEVRRAVALAAAQAYLTVLAQHRSIEVTQRALDNANAHYQYAHQRFTGGIGNQVDDVRAAQEVETNQAALSSAAAALYAAQESLGYVLGRKNPVDVERSFDLPAAPQLMEGLSSADAQRPDLASNRAALRAQQNLVDDNWAEFAPLLLAQFIPGLRDPGTATQPSAAWQLQLVLTVPFYDGGARYGTLTQRRAELAQRKAELDAALRRVSSEVRVAYEAARRADASLLAARRAANYAAQALRFASQAYEAGASTNIEVVDAERRARDADTAVVIAEDAARQARVSLLAATGRFP